MNEIDIHRGLEQDARVVEERMPMKLTGKRIAEVAEGLRKFLNNKGLTQADAARSIGVSGAQISQFIQGKYKGDLEGLVNKVVNYMNTTARQSRKKGKTPDYVQTTVARRIFTMIKQTEAFSDNVEAKMCLIIGDAGHGKSVCLREYAKANRNSVYVELDDTMSPTAVFAAIAKALTLDNKLKIDSSGSLRALSQRLVEKLANRMMTIMLDEAAGLKVHQLNQLRQVITVRCKCPLIISGNSHLLSTINQDVTKRGNESLDQFRSRLLGVLNLDELAAGRGDDGEGIIYTAKDIRTLYEQLGVKLSGDAVSTMQKICRTPQTGRLRTCSHIMMAICMSPIVKPGQTVDEKYIMSAIHELNLPVIDRLPMSAVEERNQKQTKKVAHAG